MNKLMKPFIVVLFLGTLLTYRPLSPMERIGRWLRGTRTDASRTISLEALAFVTAAALVTGVLYYWKKMRRETSGPLEEPDIPSPSVPTAPVVLLPACLAQVTINEQQAYDKIQRYGEAAYELERETYQLLTAAEELPLDQLVPRYESIKKQNQELNHNISVLAGLLGPLTEEKDVYLQLEEGYERNLPGADHRNYYPFLGLTIEEGVCLTSSDMLKRIDSIKKGIGEHSIKHVKRQLPWIFSQPWSKNLYDLWLYGPEVFKEHFTSASNRDDLSAAYDSLRVEDSAVMKIANYLDKLRTMIRKDKEWQRVKPPTH